MRKSSRTAKNADPLIAMAKKRVERVEVRSEKRLYEDLARNFIDGIRIKMRTDKTTCSRRMNQDDDEKYQI